jgi:hypothetical protein
LLQLLPDLAQACQPDPQPFCTDAGLERARHCIQPREGCQQSTLLSTCRELCWLTFPIQVHDKFKLELDDEQAVKYFQDLLETSIQALFPRLVEAAHTFAQMMRK